MPIATLAALALAAVLPADVAALGVVTCADPARSVALLRGEGRSRFVRVGDEVFGARVVAVEARAVVLEEGGTRYELRVRRGPAAAPLQTSTPPPVPPLEEGALAMPRAEVQRRLGEEVPRILAETTLMPVYDGGRVVGFTVARLPTGTLLSDAGLLPGDVLMRVNGTTVDSLGTLAGLWSRLQGEAVIQAEILRNGHPRALTLHLR